jgi:micrococcal nuclease
MKKTVLLIAAASFVAGWAWIFNSGSRKRSPIREKVQQPEKTSTIIYHGNARSLVFHNPSCKFYNARACSESFSRREDAIASGYKPCTLCLP